MSKKMKLIIIIIEIIVLLGLSGYRVYEYINKASNVNENVKKYKVTLDYGDNAVRSIEVEENKKIEFPDKPIKEGYIFDGWLLNNVIIDNNYEVKEDITLKANWINENINSEIKILVYEINIRQEADVNSTDLGDVYMNEVYEVLDIVETETYTWYKIKRDNVVGYVANQKGESWVEFVYNNDENLTIDSQLINNLILPIVPTYGNFNIVSSYNDIINKNIDIETAKNSDLLYIVLNYMDVMDVLLNDKRDNLIFIDFEKINYYARKIFGNDVKLMPETIKIVSGCLVLNVNYSEKDNGYWINQPNCGGISNIETFMDMISVKKENNDIIIDYAVYYTNLDTYDIKLPMATRSIIIYDFISKKEIDRVSLEVNLNNEESLKELDEMFSSRIIELMNKNKLSKYKATFKIQSDGNYYFAKGEWQ